MSTPLDGCLGKTVLFWICLERGKKKKKRRKERRKKTVWAESPAAVGRTTNDEGGKEGPNLRLCDANVGQLGERNYNLCMRAARERESDLFKQVGWFARINARPCNYRNECVADNRGKQYFFKKYQLRFFDMGSQVTVSLCV